MTTAYGEIRKWNVEVLFHTSPLHSSWRTATLCSKSITSSAPQWWAVSIAGEVWLHEDSGREWIEMDWGGRTVIDSIVDVCWCHDQTWTIFDDLPEWCVYSQILDILAVAAGLWLKLHNAGNGLSQYSYFNLKALIRFKSKSPLGGPKELSVPLYAIQSVCRTTKLASAS